MSRLREDFVRAVIPWLAIAGFAVLAMVFGARYLHYQAEPVASAALVSEPSAVELAVQRQGNLLVVRWNPNLSAVASATHGLLSITDGEFERRIGLNAQDLQSGTARYAPISRSVSFQLSVYRGPASGKGTVLFLAKDADDNGDEPEVNESQLAPAAPPSFLKQVPRAFAKVTSAKVRRRNADDDEQEEEPVVKTRAVPTPAVTTPSPLPTEPVRTAVVTAPPIQIATPLIPPIPAIPLPTYRVTVTSGPARTNRLEQVLGKVPFVRRIAKAPTNGELVQPLKKVEPQLVGAQITEPIDTSVEIHVDEDGEVKSAKFVDLERAPGNLEWASLRAAQSWKFESPKDGQSSWLVLTFHYEPVRSIRSE